MKKLATVLALGLLLGLPAHAADAPAAGKNAQQNRMAACNKDAGDRKGDERKKFMSECLKAKPAAVSQQDKMKACNAQAKDMKGDERKRFMSDCLKKDAKAG